MVHDDSGCLGGHVQAFEVEVCLAGVVVEPGRPKGPLRVSEVTDTSVTLAWGPPDDLGGGDLISYVIEARRVDQADIIK